jgi:2-polyprenyl-6-methoxyphenol hydroxylase-like FAD-dependent oxidoreductase
MLSVAIIGAGMGGLTAAAALLRVGIQALVYEQAGGFTRIGAGIQILPNSMKVLRRIGVEERLRRFAFAPKSHLNRVWDTGEVLIELAMPETRFDAPYLCMHRGDLHEALVSVLPAGSIELGKKLIGLEQRGSPVEMLFADGTRETADAVIGADGLHSVVREILFGPGRSFQALRRAPKAADLSHSGNFECRHLVERAERGESRLALRLRCLDGTARATGAGRVSAGSIPLSAAAGERVRACPEVLEGVRGIPGRSS